MFSFFHLFWVQGRGSTGQGPRFNFFKFSMMNVPFTFLYSSSPFESTPPVHHTNYTSSKMKSTSAAPSCRKRLSLRSTLLLSLALLSWISSVSAFGSSNQKVLLQDVQTLTLHRGRMTTGRRTSPVPQLNCIGGNACGDFEPGTERMLYVAMLETIQTLLLTRVHGDLQPN